MGLQLDVYNLGGDAVKNMFEVYYYHLPEGVSSAHGLIDAAKGNAKPSLRTNTISIPQAGITTYEVPFKTVTLKMPGGKLEWDAQFTTEFRIDRYWELYRDLVVWRNKLCSPDGSIGEDVYYCDADGAPLEDKKEANTRCGWVDVRSYILRGGLTLNAQDNPQHMWRFLRCFPAKINNVEFTYADGQNITVSVDFGFVEMEDWQKRDDGLDNLNTRGVESFKIAGEQNAQPPASGTTTP